MLTTLIAFLAVLGVLVLVHEAGHFFTARAFGVRVEEFGFGIPPRLFGFYKDAEGKWRGIGAKTREVASTIWSLNWIPLGGFVKITGEAGEDLTSPDSFARKPIWQRMAILSAGVTMNIVLAVALLTVGLMVGSPQLVDQTLPASAKVRDVRTVIVDVLPNSPAAQAGIEAGDQIRMIDGVVIAEVSDVQNYLSDKENTPVLVSVTRGQEEKNITVAPVILAETNKSGIGVSLAQTGLVSYPWYTAPWYAIVNVVTMIGGVIYGFYAVLKGLIFSQQLVGEVYGPVGIATLVGDATRLGFLYVLQFTAVLSVIIAVVNFLPFPALDGGRVFFLLIEAIRRKPINPKFEAAMHNIGFALLMLLVLVVTFKDIGRLIGGFSSLGARFMGLF